MPGGYIWEWSTGVLVTHNLAGSMGTESHLALTADDKYKIFDLPDPEGIGVLCESSEWCTLHRRHMSVMSSEITGVSYVLFNILFKVKI